MKKNSLWLPLLVLIFIMSLIACACAPARKPVPESPSPARKNIVTDQASDAQAKANRIAQACNTVSGVEDATVVVSGNTCYVGLDVEGNIEEGETERVENACVNKALAVDPSVTRCVVSSDADTVSRIENIYQGVRNGTPISSFGNELEEIGRRITPKVKK